MTATQRSIAVGILGWMLVSLFAAAMCGGLSVDKQQFVASGAVLAREGALPYRDFAFSTRPIWFSPTASCSFGTIIYCFPRASFLSGAHRSPCFSFAGAPGRVWPATRSERAFSWSPPWPFSSFRTQSFATPRGAPGTIHYRPCGRPRRCSVSGEEWRRRSGRAAFSERACCSRLPPARGFPLRRWPGGVSAVVFFLPRSANPRQRLTNAGWLVAGGLIGALPALWIFWQDSAAFLFDNLTWNGAVNALYRAAGGPAKQFTLADKLLYAAREVARNPGNLALVFLVRHPAPARFRKNPRNLLVLVSLPCLLVGALAPPIPYEQYFFAMIPVLALALVQPLAALQEQDRAA